MKLSVIVVSYNVRGYLSLCLASALKAMEKVGKGRCELFVVDNASHDGSVDWVSQHHPEVQLIPLEDNVGFSAANNLALEQARGEWVLLLNPDTIVPEDTFERILAHVEGDPRIGGLGVPMFDGSGAWLPESKRGIPTPWASFCRLSGLWRLAPSSKALNSYYFGHIAAGDSGDVEVLSGAFMWMRRSALDEVGFLDDSFFMYGEDIDLSIRILNGGWRNHYFNHAPVVHFKGESTKKGSLSHVRVFHDAMRIFTEKHFAGGQALMMRIMIRLGIRLRAASAFVHAAVSRHMLSIAEAALAVFAGAGVLLFHGASTGMMHPWPPMLALMGAGAFSTWWAGRWFGTADRPFHRLRSLMGGVAAALSVMLLYALLPEDLRVSRFSALVLAICLLVLPYLVRAFLVALKTKHFRWRMARPTIGIVARENRLKDIEQWVQSSYGSSLEIMVLSPNLPTGHEAGMKACDMVLMDMGVGGARCLQAIREAGMWGSDLRIVPDDMLLALGGADRDGAPTAALGWGADGLGRKDRMRAKKRLDLVWALVILAVGPGKGLHGKQFTRKSAWHVLVGRKVWLGFHGGWDGEERLPKLPEGVLFVGKGGKAASETEARRLDLRHAADFGWLRDLELLMNLRID